MPPLAQELFNAGTVPAAWTAQAAGGSVLVEDASGSGALKLTGGAGVAFYTNLGTSFTSLYATLPSGDFDVALVFQQPVSWVGGANGAGPSLTVGQADGDAYRFVKLEAFPAAEPVSAFAYSHTRTAGGGFADEDLSDVTPKRAGASVIGDPFGCRVLRLRRVGTTLTAFFPAFNNVGALAWTQMTVAAADPLAGGAGRIQIAVDAGVTCIFRGLLVLTAGALAAPSAPTGGKAASAPSADDLDLGVMAVWSAPSSNVARRVEIQSATDATFTTAVRTARRDLLMDGEKPTARRGGCSAGQTISFRARFVDELGQAGAWSATVSAAAAVTPVVGGVTNYYGSPKVVSRTARNRVVVMRP